MKTKLKLKSIMLFAMAVLIALTLIVCDLPEEEEETDFLSGTISITGDTYVGATLTAIYTGDELNTVFRWYRGNQDLGVVQDTYQPTQPGSYFVTVQAPGYRQEFSAPVNVTDHAAFFGEWRMVGSEQTSTLWWNETVSITHKEFRTIDTTSELIDGELERFHFDITKWEEAENHSTNATLVSNFPRGFKLSISITLHVGFTDLNPDLSTIYLFMNDDGTRFVRANLDPENGDTIFLGRVYTKHTP